MKPSPVFCEIPYGSEAYRAECELRQAVLRLPLGLSLYEEDLGAEATQLHFGLFETDTLLACIIANPVSSSEVKLRQMAVSPNHQGRGYGHLLLKKLETELSDRGYTAATLHARASAIDFYRKAGFKSFGSEFMEIGIPHQQMVKHFSGKAQPIQDLS
ncbi:MAG: GNAT family N-acetyltransferase [Porticoccaceae bacterium]|nr:GNAT family N-acetyltransferase [Porticoccaceae bacterium]